MSDPFHLIHCRHKTIDYNSFKDHPVSPEMTPVNFPFLIIEPIDWRNTLRSNISLCVILLLVAAERAIIIVTL